MKNPKWHRDEIILALDLYFRIDPDTMHSSNPEVIDLSEVLNKLPIHTFRPDQEKFRNPNGVSLKLSNFKGIDPDYTSSGMQSYSKLDEEVFWDFHEDKGRLKSIAARIQGVVKIPDLNDKLFEIQSNEQEESSVKEGGVILKLHKYRERDSSIIRKKKQLALETEGKLICEVCGFDSEDNYGDIGKGFIECHHRVPLSKLESGANTKLDDLALVCSNCHRMLHRRMESISTIELADLIDLKDIFEE